MFAFHIDMNYAAFRKDALMDMVDMAAAVGFDTILWEIEDKVRLDALGPSVHPDAMCKTEFKELLSHAESLHLNSFPLLQTLGHAEYVLKDSEHFSLRENDSPDCYCATSPAVRSFLKKMITEIADLFDNPQYFHLGGDEAYNYRTCGKCLERDLSDLFIEHELDLASLLFERGIQPCMWADMLRNHPEIREKFDRRFMIWLWNYSYTTEWEDEDKLRESGYELVICPAASSGTDSPFLPRWEDHLSNIAGAANLANKNHLIGICVTSWSIRMGLKCIQLPLLQLSKEVFLAHADFREVEKKLKNEYFGSADPNALCSWEWFLYRLSGVLWHRYKDGVLPPPGLVAERLRENAQEYKELATRLPEMIRIAQKAQKQLSGTSKIQSLIAHGAALRLRYLQYIEALLNGKSCSVADMCADKQKFTDFLMLEQTPRSAAHNASLTYDPLIEYAASMSGK